MSVLRVAATGFGRRTLLGRAVDLASFYASALLTLLKITRAGDVIIAKTDPPLLSIMAQAVGRLKRARVVNWLQDIYPEVASALGMRSLGGPVGRALAAWRNASLRAAHSNVVLGERMASHLQAQGIAARQIRIIPNWSDEAAFGPSPHEVAELRATWGLGGKFVVGYSGNLGRAHEYETMIGAAAALRDDPRIAFLMVGGGHQVAGLKAAADGAGLANIVFQPYQPREALAASLSAADLHWISLKPELEGLIVPSKVYGILAAGRPILAVGDADGEIARLVREHACGLHVAPGDSEGFAGVVRALAASPDRARALGEAARRASTTRFSKAGALASWRETVLAATARVAPVPTESNAGRLVRT